MRRRLREPPPPKPLFSSLSLASFSFGFSDRGVAKVSSFGPTRWAGVVLFPRAGALSSVVSLAASPIGLAALALGLAVLGLAAIGLAATPGLSSVISMLPSAPLTVVDKVGAALGLAPLGLAASPLGLAPLCASPNPVVSLVSLAASPNPVVSLAASGPSPDISTSPSCPLPSGKSSPLVNPVALSTAAVTAETWACTAFNGFNAFTTSPSITFACFAASNTASSPATTAMPAPMPGISATVYLIEFINCLTAFPSKFPMLSPNPFCNISPDCCTAFFTLALKSANTCCTAGSFNACIRCNTSGVMA